jgi:hypothetical protein
MLWDRLFMGGSRRLERPVPALLVLGRRAYVEIAARLAIRSCSGGGDSFPN